MDGSQNTPPPDIRRRRFSAADVQAMLKAGVLKDGEHVELLWGELVEMSPQGPLHWDVTHILEKWFRRNLPPHLDYATQGPLRLSKYHEPEPELFVFSEGVSVNDVRGSDCVLVIEVAHSSLDFDLHVKGPIYAKHGIPEYWVIDVENGRTLLHRLEPSGEYGEPRHVAFDAPLAAPGGQALFIANLKPKG